LTIQIPLLYSHNHVFCRHGVKIRHLKERWLRGLLQKKSLEKYLVREMALGFCSVKLARLCPAEPFLGKSFRPSLGVALA
jgi:hypothetical protein